VAKDHEKAIKKSIANLSNSEYRTKARPNQLPPEGDWRIWLMMCGRGFGKTWVGSRFLVEQVLMNPGTDWFVAAPTFGDVKRICIEGPSGLLKAIDRADLQYYNKTEQTLMFRNGSRIYGLSADTPERARGLNLAGGWIDELGSWRYTETWTEGIAPALRIGNPRVVITTTPRPTELIKTFTSRTDGTVAVTRGSTFDNADNLSESALAELRSRYEGTRLGRQELFGELIEDVEGALWTSSMILRSPTVEYSRVIVAIDPATTSGSESDETGIIVVAKGIDGRGYVLADRSCRESPNGWATRAIAAYEEFGADRIVAEKNQGGDMVEQTIKSVSNVPYKGITAKIGKRLRAEPIAALYEQGRVSHVGIFEKLEDQMLGWVPDSGYSPDRLDALVHGLQELGLATGSSADRFFASIAPNCPHCGFPNAYDTGTCSSCNKQLRVIDTVKGPPTSSYEFGR
jgi:phage terminase large subunit-like protein